MICTPLAAAIAFCYLIDKQPILAFLSVALFAMAGTAIIIFFPKHRKTTCQAPPAPTKPVRKPVKVYKLKCGEFLEAMKEVFNAPETPHWLFRTWYKDDIKIGWENFSNTSLTQLILEGFVEDMICTFQKMASESNGSEDYQRLLVQKGHTFMRAVRAKCLELELNVDGIDFDASLSYADAVAHASA